jgi:hypothetical protein
LKIGKENILRLKNASLGELSFRLKQIIHHRYYKRQLENNRLDLNIPTIDMADADKLKLPAFEGAIPEHKVQEILNDSVISLNTEKSEIYKFESKNQNTFFSDIKIDPDSSDVRAVWEPARLQHVTILLLYLLENQNDNDIEQFAKDDVIAWIGNNPFLLGLHYKSAMECGLRIPVFFYSLKVLNNLKDPETQIIYDSIYSHAWWIERNLSLYASLGNHTICECVGLVFAGAVFRKHEDGRKWLDTGCRLLDQELSHQILEDGGPAEQSLSYHRFVLDLYWLAQDFLEKNQLYDCSVWRDRLLKGDAFLAAFRDESGNFPSIGDCDDGYAAAPGVGPLRGEASAPVRIITTYTTSGYTVIRGERCSLLTFDHGPLGMPPFCNHGHADALSFTYTVSNRPFLIDPGTYKYNGVPEWRKYFKGTRAHNTVTIDDLDQAVQETGFIWSHPYKTELIKNLELDSGHLLKAVHDGYNRLKYPVIHERSICWLEHSNLMIKDSFAGEGIHRFELNFHFHPEAILTEDESWWEVDNRGTKIFITISGDDRFEHIKGQENPISGWFSPVYGIKEPCSVLRCSKNGKTDEVSFFTVISTDRVQDVKSLQDNFDKIEKQAENS